jgi:hypothetical protein
MVYATAVTVTFCVESVAEFRSRFVLSPSSSKPRGASVLGLKSNRGTSLDTVTSVPELLKAVAEDARVNVKKLGRPIVLKSWSNVAGAYSKVLRNTLSCTTRLKMGVEATNLVDFPGVVNLEDVQRPSPARSRDV